MHVQLSSFPAFCRLQTATASAGKLLLNLDQGVDVMRRLFLAVLVILTLSFAANAQTFRGAINGTVTDPSGGSVPNAQVKATETATGLDHTTFTTTEGQFSFQDIALGTYKVSVVAEGFPT